ncbi:MAG: lipid A deacylase LpxR family protein [Algisphaera sp.]
MAWSPQVFGQPGAVAEASGEVLTLADSDVASGAAPSFYFENDGTFMRPNDHTDRHYTSGQGVSVAWRGAGRKWAQSLGIKADGTAMGLVLAQQMFTPDDIELTPAPGDRPYAGYLFAGGFWQRQWGGVFDHVQLDLGVVGPSSLAEETQEAIHAFSYAPDPDWDTQLRDELAVNLTLRRKWRLDLGESSLGGRPMTLQLIPRVEADLGTVYRRVGAGVMLRYGYHLPNDFGPGRMLDLASEINRPFEGRAAGLSTYVFGRALGRYVDWNTFLDGSNARNPSPSVERIAWVGEFSGGFAVEWKRYNLHTRLAYMQTYTTREFETQGSENTVGSLALRVTYRF